MLGHYDSLSLALIDLRIRGFTSVFGIKKDHIYSYTTNLKLAPSEFTILETYRFDGSSDPGDSVAVYAIQSLTDETKGTLIIASEGFSEELSVELSRKFEKTIETF